MWRPCILQLLAVVACHSTTPLLVAELMDTSLSQLVKVERSLGNRYIRILALDVAYGINYPLTASNPIPYSTAMLIAETSWFGARETSGVILDQQNLWEARCRRKSRESVLFCSGGKQFTPDSKGKILSLLHPISLSPPPRLTKSTVFIGSEKPLICRQ